MLNRLSQLIKDRKKKKNQPNAEDVPLVILPLPEASGATSPLSGENPREPLNTPGKIKWRLPNWEQFKFLLKSLSDNEKKLVVGALFFACILLAAWGITVYLKDTNRKPALGGSYSEGIQGQPLYLNPVVAHSNPTDSDLSMLIFSSLFRYNSEGKLEQDLVDNWERSENGLVYTVHLKSNIKWHDGKPLTAEDVLFTLNLIKNPAFASTLRGNWEGIEVVKVNENTLTFTLKKAYTPFLHNLTFGILPKHLWQDIPSDKFLLTELNRKPVGSGMYLFNRMDKDQNGRIISVTLRANREYYGPKPHLNELVFRFYSSPAEIFEATQKREIRGIANIEPSQVDEVNNSGDVKIYQIPTTRIYGIFFNQKKSAIIAEKNIREALSLATDKEALLKDALNNQGIVVNTPLTPNMLGYKDDLNKYDFNPERAKNILKEADWEKLDDKERKKFKDQPDLSEIALYNSKSKKFLTLTLTVPDYPELVKTADILKKQWANIGLDLKLDIVDTSETLQNKISDRNYELLLFGEVLQADPDPTPFWHSNSKQAPGLNLAMFENGEVDKILDSARQEVNEEKRADGYKEFQEYVIKETPAIFLFSPYYLYGVSGDYQGVGNKVIFNPWNRFDDISNRYLYTTRMRK